MGRFDVGDDQPALGRARRGRGKSLADRDRGQGRDWAMRRPSQRGDIVVQPPAQALVELLGSVDVGHRDDLNLQVKVDLPDGRVAAGLCTSAELIAAS